MQSVHSIDSMKNMYTAELLKDLIKAKRFNKAVAPIFIDVCLVPVQTFYSYQQMDLPDQTKKYKTLQH